MQKMSLELQWYVNHVIRDGVWLGFRKNKIKSNQIMGYLIWADLKPQLFDLIWTNTFKYQILSNRTLCVTCKRAKNIQKILFKRKIIMCKIIAPWLDKHAFFQSLRTQAISRGWKEKLGSWETSLWRSRRSTYRKIFASHLCYLRIHLLDTFPKF